MPSSEQLVIDGLWLSMRQVLAGINKDISETMTLIYDVDLAERIARSPRCVGVRVRTSQL